MGMITAGAEREVAHADLAQVASELSKAAEAWRHGREVDLDAAGLTRGIEGAVAVLLRHKMPELLKAMASQAGRADTMLARCLDGDTIAPPLRVLAELTELRDSVKMLGELHRQRSTARS
jgi:hypothetical protein